ncbi:STAS domain-containing protein [Frateuria terrea]|uniref:RsbT co-antagonist protein RsbR n=1 Tax=Frateuria terrea TaxID=529704 RepID=A0A1H6UL71_9GAMM|nr:STAS domain-containing protein [Frateuria terrea]SEI91464.1 rsbT co-antagonist protein RsbR [Frateuria terrea]SFP35924.1 rsbT co-antagonist protein RsbR [Frateuria terrea]
MAELRQRTLDVLGKNQKWLLDEWNRDLSGSGVGNDNRIGKDELGQQTAEFLDLMIRGATQGGGTGIGTAAWGDVRAFLEALSRSRALQGFDSLQTANFIFSIKRPLFALLQRELGDEPALLAEQLWAISEILDSLGMHTVNSFQKSREDVIRRQQEELLELSTPVIKLWDGVLALPMIGTLDSQRTQVVMESLLQRIVETGAEIAIIDITGVPTVDTLVAQHLLKTVTAIRLMGADCIISGVRPQIAQTIVHLGLDLQGIVTKANLADALAMALRRNGLSVVKG